MKILLVNPNSSALITKTLSHAVTPLQSETLQIEVVCCPDAPSAIVSSYDELKAGLSVTDLLLRKEANFDAAVIGCFADPGLRAVRELIQKPVAGLYESSAIFAKFSGRKYSIIASGDESDISPWLGSVRNPGDTENLASIRYIGSTVEAAVTASDAQICKVIEQCRKQDSADAVILGCAAFAGRGKQLTKVSGLPIIDGICESVKMAEMIRTGTTCFADSHYIVQKDENFDGMAAAAKETGIRAILCRATQNMKYHPDVPGEAIENTKTALEKSEACIKKYHKTANGRIRVGVEPITPIDCNAETIQGLFALAEKYDTLFQCHAAETIGELSIVKNEHKMGIMEYLHSLNVLSGFVK